MGRSFERLMQVALIRVTCILGDRFERVRLWHEWPDRDGPDTTGIDLVVEKREGGFCALQCKFFDPHRLIPNGPLNSFQAKSVLTQCISRLIINTDGAIQHKALGTLQTSSKPCRVPDTVEPNGWDVDWLRYVGNPENLEFRIRGPYTSPCQ